jgi:hypothetical protein
VLILAEPIKNKSDLVVVFRSFLSKIQLSGYKVHIIRIDNDSVFLGADFQVVCREFDIVVHQSVPYRHHQLGKMERRWRTLSDTTVVMLHDSMLGNQFRGNAFLTAVYVRNIVWSQGSHCIPYHVMFGKLPDLSNLGVFDRQVFFHIDKIKQRKLCRKSSEGICVGYASDCPAWLVYISSTQSITRTDNDVFMK